MTIIVDKALSISRINTITSIFYRRICIHQVEYRNPSYLQGLLSLEYPLVGTWGPMALSYLKVCKSLIDDLNKYLFLKNPKMKSNQFTQIRLARGIDILKALE
jgi:hypothetical protein